MKHGEITGQLLDVHHSDIGMPMRSETTLKKTDRTNVSNIDNIIDVQDNHNDQSMFEYYDPSIIPFASDATVRMTDVQPKSTNYKKHIDERMKTDIMQRTTTLTPSINDIGTIQNLSSHNTEYLNDITIKMFNHYIDNTINTFCIFPIGILSTMIKNDINIGQILSVTSLPNIYHTVRYYPQNRLISSRTSVDLNSNQNDFMCYQNNDIHVVEFPVISTDFSLGFIKQKDDDQILLSSKIFYEYISNLRRVNINIYRPSFSVNNKLNLTNMLKYMGYIKQTDKYYSQILSFTVRNDVFIKRSTMSEQIDLSENFLFYLRYKPNNVILHIGRFLN